MTMMNNAIKGYEVHWARSNRCDEICGMRHGAQRHATRAAAETEARAISPIRPNIVTLVVEVR